MSGANYRSYGPIDACYVNDPRFVRPAQGPVIKQGRGRAAKVKSNGKGSAPPIVDDDEVQFLLFDVEDLLQKVRNVNVKDAVKQIAEFVGGNWGSLTDVEKAVFALREFGVIGGKVKNETLTKKLAAVKELVKDGWRLAKRVGLESKAARTGGVNQVKAYVQFYFKHDRFGRLKIVFKGNQGLRAVVSKAAYFAKDIRVTQFVIGQRAYLRNAVKSNLYTFVFVGAIEVWKWKGKQKDERFYSDLLIDSGIELAKSAAAGLAGYIVGSALVAAGTIGAPLLVGAAVAVFVGWALSEIDSYLEDRFMYRTRLKAAVRKAVDYLEKEAEKNYRVFERNFLHFMGVPNWIIELEMQ